MIETTGTFKHIKTILSREGFDPSKIKSPLYFCDPSIGNYVPLDSILYDKIIRGQVKLWNYVMYKIVHWFSCVDNRTIDIVVNRLYLYLVYIVLYSMLQNRLGGLELMIHPLVEYLNWSRCSHVYRSWYQWIWHAMDTCY